MNQQARAWLGMLEYARALILAVLHGPADVCGATDGAELEDGPYGRCTLPAGHPGDWHRDYRAGQLWAEWRGPHPGQRCGICGRDGAEH